jgi:hypothetical protein
MRGAHLMRRSWPILIRAAAAVAVPVLLFWPWANFYWSVFLRRPYDPVTGVPPIYVVAPVGTAAGWIIDRIGPGSVGVVEALFGALGAIGVWAGFERIRHPPVSRETRCRRCRGVLCNLVDTRCPACGEPL